MNPDETDTPAAPESAPETTPETQAQAELPWRLIARETRRLEFPLSVDEQLQIGARVGVIGRRLRELERDHEAETEAARARIAAEKSRASEESKVRADEIRGVVEEFDDALAAQTTGIERRSVDVEVRYMHATQTVDVVRLDTGETISSRPMTEADARWRQGTIDDVTAGATVGVGIEAAPEGDEPGEAISAEEAEALGLPVGWQRAWRDGEWRVKGELLTEADVREVYIQLQDEGTSLETLYVGRTGVAAIDWLDEHRIKRALSMLRKAGIVNKRMVEGVAMFAPAPATPDDPPAEPGRNDTLPEAADAPKPKRQGKTATKADAIVNAGTEQSDGWGLPTGAT